MAEEDWHGLLDHVQHLFWALSIPFGLTHLLHHLLAVYHTPAPSETLLVKVLVEAKRSPWRLHVSRSRTLAWNFPLYLHHANKEFAGVHHATEVRCIQPGEQSPQPGQDLQERVA